MFKWAHKGTYHKMSPKHLQRYVTGFAGRHNVRSTDTIDQMGRVVARMISKRLTCATLSAANGQSIEGVCRHTVEKVADRVVGGDALETEQGVGIGASVLPVQCLLEGEEGGAVGEEHGKGGHGVLCCCRCAC